MPVRFVMLVSYLGVAEGMSTDGQGSTRTAERRASHGLRIPHCAHIPAVFSPAQLLFQNIPMIDMFNSCAGGSGNEPEALAAQDAAF